jgi:Cobalt transport protein
MIWPRVKIVALIALAIGCFFVRDPWVLAGALLLEILAWCLLRLPMSPLYRTFRKLSVFALFIVISYSFLASESAPSDVWVPVSVGPWQIHFNQTGFILGIVMSLRMLVVVLASIIVQLSGNPEDFVAGLRGLGTPTLVALTIDNTLRLLNSENPTGVAPGSGRGTGGGGGRGMRRQGARNSITQELTWKRILKGDFAFLNDLIENALLRAKDITGDRGRSSNTSPFARDAAVITALCFLMITTKMLKVLPGIPFAPGYKLVVLIPFYILAGVLTQSRLGATFAGTSIGILSFLMGDGRFGVFEILKHITPGLVVDGLSPWLMRHGHQPSRWAFVAVGALCAAARIVTIVAVTLLIEAPAVFYALMAPMFISQTIFGAVSGFVTFSLLQSLHRFRQALDVPPRSRAEA